MYTLCLPIHRTKRREATEQPENEGNFKRDEKLCPYSVGSGNSRGFGILQYRDIVTKTEYIRTDSRAVADQTQWALQKLLWLSSEVNEKNEKWRQVI